MTDTATNQTKNDSAVAPSLLNVGFGMHDLYVTGDDDSPDQIKDRNGEVVLQLCKVCRKAESELRSPVCTPYPKPGEY